jgi:hypothetical protein
LNKNFDKINPTKISLFERWFPFFEVFLGVFNTESTPEQKVSKKECKAEKQNNLELKFCKLINESGTDR